MRQKNVLFNMTTFNNEILNIMTIDYKAFEEKINTALVLILYCNI